MTITMWMLQPSLRCIARRIGTSRMLLLSSSSSSSPSQSGTKPTDAVASFSSASSADAITQPTTEQLRIVAMRAAIPMVGFGMMDNIVMIQAGEAIDMSLGVAFGLSTLTAAGFGQCVSDVAGFTCGGIVDAVVNKMNLPYHGLSRAQLDLKSSRLYNTFGGCVGVVTGCLLGMSCLLFMDTDRAERAKKAKELQSIFEMVLQQGHELVHAERATLWMLDDDDNDNAKDSSGSNVENRKLWSRVATGTKGIIEAPVRGSLVGECVLTGKVINVADVYQDSRFNPKVDEKTGFTTRSVLCYPVRKDGNEDGKIIGAIQMINKKGGGGFVQADIKLVQMLASHVACFIKVVRGDEG